MTIIVKNWKNSKEHANNNAFSKEKQNIEINK